MAALRVFLASAALALPLWLAATTPAHACSAGPTTLEELVSAADLIVIGVPSDPRLLDPVPELPPLSPPDASDGYVPVGPGEAIVSVSEYLKGSGSAELSVFQPVVAVHYSQDAPPRLVAGARTSCDYSLTPGEQHLLFLYRAADGRYETSSISGSAALGQLGADEAQRIDEIRRIIAQGDPTLPPLGSGPNDARGPPFWLLFTLGGAGVALLVAPIVSRRRGD